MQRNGQCNHESSFTPDQRSLASKLHSMYPGVVDSDRIDAIFAAAGYDISSTVAALAKEFGQPAAGVALPTVRLAQSPSQAGTNSQSAMVSYSSMAARAPVAPVINAVQPCLPTFTSKNRITPLDRMAACNGCPKEVLATIEKRCLELYAEWEMKLQEEIRKSANVPARLRVHYNGEIRRARDNRRAVEWSMLEHARMWNGYLNDDIVDLHGLTMDLAKQLLNERINSLREGRMSVTLVIITGAGNRSVNNYPKIREDVWKFLKARRFSPEMLNDGCITVIFNFSNVQAGKPTRK